MMVVQLERRTMPLAPVTIDAAGRDTLLSWLRGGATGISPQTCMETKAGFESPDLDDVSE
ncbi:hypothetical protein LZC95_34200 [Pendulispora brunnea]|uniref:Uncharacterized protein n=1 Tax=Pendulispora brunnea TaxID=2905690 RepID=A0ABZ2JYQ5_9BACT